MKLTLTDFLANWPQPPLLSTSSKPSSTLSWTVAITSSFFPAPFSLFLTQCPKRSCKNLSQIMSHLCSKASNVFRSKFQQKLVVQVALRDLVLCLSDLTSWYPALPYSTSVSYSFWSGQTQSRGAREFAVHGAWTALPSPSGKPCLTSPHKSVSCPCFIFLHRLNHHLNTMFCFFCFFSYFILFF